MIATDYLYAQRAYPYGEIDLAAYQKAIEKRRIYYRINRGPFDNSWNALGPTNICGRITDLEIPSDRANAVYAGTASGGIFISEDKGDTWQAIFDEQSSLAIGDIAISKTNPDRLYVGTGEANAGGASIAYDGLGVFRSDDKGQNWTHLGLEKVGSIGRIVIDPGNDDIAFTAAMGSLFGNNSDRGIYRTQDAGSTWEQVLFVSDSTGGIDLAIHPQDGNIVYAAMWERVRKVYNRQYGGETTGIYRSKDGGESWNEMTEGLPFLPNDKGRIGLAISESEPNIVYAYYSSATGLLNGIYKTEDGGDNWSLVQTDLITSTFNWWFGKIYVHPKNSDELYLTNVTMFRSVDGGENWQHVFQDAHIDHHAMAIHQEDSTLVYNGNDGGVNLVRTPAYDSSYFKSGMNSLQFYTCEIDPNNSRVIYGGSQDNGILKSTTDSLYWRQILGGDGFHIEVDPSNSNKIFFELFYGTIRTSDDAGESVDFAFTGLEGKFNFNAPLVLDPNDSSILYTGSQTLFRSDDQAQSWTSISPVLINENNPIGNIRYGTITAIDVSVHDSKLIYIGTDDGKVWRTRDGGMSYELISDSLPQRWVTTVVHDPHNSSGVYVSFSGFRFNEAKAQIFYSSNYGDTWTAIGSGLPDIPINDIQPDGLIEEAIYVATDIGVFATEDRGAQWQLLGNNMPVVSVQDLDIHNEDRVLAAATFGKGMFTYDLPLPVAIDEAEQASVLIYPNPASEYIIVKTDRVVSDFRIFDSVGRLMVEKEEEVIDISTLPAGIYTVQVKVGEDLIIKSFIKQD